MTLLRVLVVVAAVAIAAAAGEVAELVSAFMRSSQFAVLLISVGAAVPVALRLDRLDNEARPEAAATAPLLPRQREGVEEGAR